MLADQVVGKERESRAAARMCLPRLMGDRLMGNRLGSRLWALGGTWHARSSGPPCLLPAYLPTPGSSSPSSCLSVDRGAKQPSTVKHMTTSCSFLPTITRLTRSLPNFSCQSRAGQRRIGLGPGPGIGLEGTSHRTTSHHKHNNRPDCCFLLQVMPSPAFSWSHSLPHLVLPLQDTDHFRPDTYGAPAVPLGPRRWALPTPGIIRNHHRRASCGANVPL